MVRRVPHVMSSDGPLFLPELVSGRGTVRRSRMVEGQPRLRGRDNPPHDTVQIAKHLACGNPHRRDTVRLEPRSEEHTSELQSLMRISYAVFCLKKKKTD